MQWFKRLQQVFDPEKHASQDGTEIKPRFESMTAQKVDFNFRVYWTKMTLGWAAEQRQAAREMAQRITQAPDFNANLIEKRYQLPLAGIPEETHSGASIRALLVVLAALDAAEEQNQNE